MTLQSSGTIKLSEIQTEFGGTNPISISEYYGADTGVPSSGVIDMSDFYGTSSASPVVVAGNSASDTEFLGGTARAYLTAATDGSVAGLGDSVTADEWYTGSPVANIGSGYEIRATLSGGTVPSSGTIGSWLPLSTFRRWEQQTTSLGTRQCSLYIEIRDATTLQVLADGTWNISATVII